MAARNGTSICARPSPNCTNCFYYDRLYIGGGNAAEIKIKLPSNACTISNQDGLLGGIKLWDRDLEDLNQ